MKFMFTAKKLATTCLAAVDANALLVGVLASERRFGGSPTKYVKGEIIYPGLQLILIYWMWVITHTLLPDRSSLSSPIGKGTPVVAWQS